MLRRLLPAVAALLVLSGCGGAATTAQDAITPQPVTRSETASASTSAPGGAGTPRPAVGDTLTLAALAAGTENAMRAQGSVRITAAGRTPDSDGVTLVDTRTGDARMETGANHQVSLVVDHQLYEAMTHGPLGIPGKKWILEDTQGFAEAELASVDPINFLGQLHATARVTSVSDGVTYEVTIPGSEFQRWVDGLSSSNDPTSASPEPTLVLTLAYDAHGLPHTIEMVDQSGQEGTDTLTFSDWGVPVHVVAPPRSEVVLMSTLLKGLPGQPMPGAGPATSVSGTPTSTPTAAPPPSGGSNAVPGTAPSR